MSDPKTGKAMAFNRENAMRVLMYQEALELIYALSSHRPTTEELGFSGSQSSSAADTSASRPADAPAATN